jgi:hypothetical protein
MQNYQTKWDAACIELNKKLRQYDGRPFDLASDGEINYFAARRFLISGIKNRGRNAEKLCAFFKISIDETAKPRAGALSDLTGVLRDVWDGSEAHAKLLARLIESTKSFRIEGRTRKQAGKR